MFPFGISDRYASHGTVNNKLKIFLEPVEPVVHANGIHMSANISLLHRLGDENRVIMKGTA